jgi:hypothetical protein
LPDSEAAPKPQVQTGTLTEPTKHAAE